MANKKAVAALCGKISLCRGDITGEKEKSGYEIDRDAMEGTERRLWGTKPRWRGSKLKGSE